MQTALSKCQILGQHQLCTWPRLSSADVLISKINSNNNKKPPFLKLMFEWGRVNF